MEFAPQFLDICRDVWTEPRAYSETEGEEETMPHREQKSRQRGS